MTAPALDPGGAPDAVDRHVAVLERALRGPARMRRCILAEARDGLRDAAAAHHATGVAPAVAAERAVREFGPVRGIAALYQDELTVAQGRRTALLLAVVFPALLLGWDAVWAVGPADAATPSAMRMLARSQDTISWVAGGLAVALVLLTLWRGVRPRLLTVAVAGTGLGAAALCLGATVAMHVVDLAGITRALATHPLLAPAYPLTLVALVVLLRSTGRTLALARLR